MPPDVEKMCLTHRMNDDTRAVLAHHPFGRSSRSKHHGRDLRRTGWPDACSLRPGSYLARRRGFRVTVSLSPVATKPTPQDRPPPRLVSRGDGFSGVAMPATARP